MSIIASFINPNTPIPSSLSIQSRSSIILVHFTDSKETHKFQVMIFFIDLQLQLLPNTAASSSRLDKGHGAYEFLPFLSPLQPGQIHAQKYCCRAVPHTASLCKKKLQDKQGREGDSRRRPCHGPWSLESNTQQTELVHDGVTVLQGNLSCGSLFLVVGEL